MKNKRSKFENVVIPILNYIGFIGASILIIAYIATVIILIVGFKVQKKELLDVLLFAAINAIIGILIMSMLKIQGVSFAKNLPENKEILRKYYNTKTKDKKARSISSFWIRSTLKDIFVKASTVGVSTYLVIDIVIKGSNDWTLMLLAFVNLLMFISFGLLALTGAYEFYNNNHIPYILEKLEDREKILEAQKLEREVSDDFKTLYRSINKFLEQAIAERESIDKLPDIQYKEL